MRSKAEVACFSSKSDEWATPDWLYELLDKEFSFDLDVAASKENARTKRFFSKSKNGLVRDWAGACFMNPPYSNIAEWAEKAYNESCKGGCIVVGLLPVRSDTRYWHNFVMKAKEIRFIAGRLVFKGAKYNAPFPSCIVIWHGPHYWPRLGPRYVNCP